ncbi:MAG: VWA domain-containing protein [Acidobacteriota bacterium]|nr:VWA domain-containing protein [Acidobacteriota bacterium]
MKRIIWIIAMLAAAIGLFAQVKETVNVYVVEVPVTVVDSNGNPVRGLTAANFELSDNGTKRAVSSFDKIDFASTDSVTAISPLNPNARRQFMLLFDLGYSSPNSLTRAQDAARKFIKESVQPRDLVSVGTIEPDRGFRLLSAFTTDRALVASAIDNPIAFRGTDPLQIANQTEAFQPATDTTGGGAGGSGNKAIADEEIRQMAASMKHVNEAAVRQRVEKEIDFLGQLAKTLRAVPGRKQIVLLTEGFDAAYLQGRDVRASADAANENEQILRGQVYNIDNDARFGNTASMTTLDRMAQFFRQSDVVLNAIDIQGVRVQNNVQQGASINSNAGLFLLARPTGGEVFENVNNLKTNFDRMLKQQEVVYVLGFQAPTQKPGTFHNLKVKLVNVPGARVFHRAGYFESGGETPAERTLSNAEIIINDIPQAEVHLDALSAAFPGSGKNAQVPVILEINGSDLTKDVRGNAANVEIFIYAFDSDGIVRDRLYQRLGLDLKKVGDKLRATGIKYYGTLSLPPGRYAVKSLIREIDTERRGFGRTDITVPETSTSASLQPVPIDDQANWILVKGSRDAKAAYPFVLNGQQFIPSAVARQKVALFVYGAKPEDLTLETTPKTTILGRAQSLDGSALVLQLNPADARVATLDITVHTKGVADAKKVSVPIAQ